MTIKLKSDKKIIFQLNDFKMKINFSGNKELNSNFIYVDQMCALNIFVVVVPMTVTSTIRNLLGHL